MSARMPPASQDTGEHDPGDARSLGQTGNRNVKFCNYPSLKTSPGCGGSCILLTMFLVSVVVLAIHQDGIAALNGEGESPVAIHGHRPTPHGGLPNIVFQNKG